ncbi:unnamed protein product [marine sediment metagenome]|uniref:Cyclophilin-like domain-containing protein n=1 Tax=marine sediment metagenome TaxID=412755 RepID=X1JV56_9ZZZZ
MKVKNLLNNLDRIAPFFLQESSDNSGIQFANLDAPITKILLSLDVTQGVLNEAIENKVNLIITHHPLLFSPLKQITKQKNPLLFKIITNKINLLALHTNYDLAENGLNDYVANLLGIKEISPLQGSSEKVFKFAVYVPVKHADKVSQAIFKAGAGKIGKYTETSFNISGKGTFKPMEGTNPFMGKIGERENVEEIKIETVVAERDLDSVVQAMKDNHPYEEPAFDVYELKTKPSYGIGIFGEIDKEVEISKFSLEVKNRLKACYIRLIKSNNRKIRKVALCTGSGGSLLEQVSRKNVDLYITGDITYHTALRAKELGLNVLDVEHFDTEKFFVEALYNQLIKMAVKKITITTEDLKVDASLNDSETAQKIWEALPIEGSVNTWGDEIYFSIPVNVGLENAKAVVSEGDLGYWPPGNAFCIFFGLTPASQGDEIRPASPVNIFGKVIGDPTAFKKVRSGAKIIIEKSE